MNHLLAKIKGREGSDLLFKILSNSDTFFSLPDNIADCAVEYTPDYKPDEDEWFQIRRFSSKEYSLDILQSDFISVECDQLSVSLYPEILYFIGQQSSKLFFQRLSPRQMIQKNTSQYLMLHS